MLGKIEYTKYIPPLFEDTIKAEGTRMSMESNN